VACSKPKAAGKDNPGRSRSFCSWFVFSVSFVLPVSAAADSADAAQGLTAAEARGRIIYTTGRSESGALLHFRLHSAGDRLLPARGVVCASCHGPDGRGGQEGIVVMADIAYGALTKPMTSPPAWKRTRAPYTDALVARAITDGIDSSGQHLDGMMPRWVMQESDLQDLLQYLKRLGRHDRR
jgi:mono/diheme cytochrome c family protein